jgi:hypothetical protein
LLRTGGKEKDIEETVNKKIIGLHKLATLY